MNKLILNKIHILEETIKAKHEAYPTAKTISLIEEVDVLYNSFLTDDIDDLLVNRVYDLEEQINSQPWIKPVQIFTVTFDSKGGTVIPPQMVVEGETADRPTDPTKTSYQFMGWLLQGTTGTFFDFDTPIEDDITLEAIFAEIHTITFNSDGGSVVAPQYVLDGEKVIKPVNPTKNGFIFDGWTKGSVAFNFNTVVNSSFELKATWEAEVTQYLWTFEDALATTGLSNFDGEYYPFGENNPNYMEGDRFRLFGKANASDIIGNYAGGVKDAGRSFTIHSNWTYGEVEEVSFLYTGAYSSAGGRQFYFELLNTDGDVIVQEWMDPQGISGAGADYFTKSVWKDIISSLTPEEKLMPLRIRWKKLPSNNNQVAIDNILIKKAV